MINLDLWKTTSEIVKRIDEIVKRIEQDNSTENISLMKFYGGEVQVNQNIKLI